MSRTPTIPRARHGKKQEKVSINFPAPTLGVLKKFSFEWNERESQSSAWSYGSFEHFLPGTLGDQKYLFVLKGSSYGRTYYIYRGEESKPVIRVLNLKKLKAGLEVLTADSKGKLIEYLIHPDKQLRKVAEARIKDFDNI